MTNNINESTTRKLKTNPVGSNKSVLPHIKDGKISTQPKNNSSRNLSYDMGKSFTKTPNQMGNGIDEEANSNSKTNASFVMGNLNDAMEIHRKVTSSNSAYENIFLDSSYSKHFKRSTRFANNQNNSSLSPELRAKTTLDLSLDPDNQGASKANMFSRENQQNQSYQLAGTKSGNNLNGVGFDSISSQGRDQISSPALGILGGNNTMVSVPSRKSAFKKQRGPVNLKNNIIETWINDTCMEALVNQKFETLDNLAVLKKYGIDRKTLKGKGVSNQYVERLYRCLFVYSFGFYEMLNTIFEHTPDSTIIMASIWKVFGILLEYCSRSDFKSVVSELEREKRNFIQQMEIQISKRDQQIHEIQTREKDKQEKLSLELKGLQQERQNLIVEKNQIEEDFQQADQAFNEEVSLRLKFQHKINEIHGIHRELVMKHEILMEDLEKFQEKNLKLTNELGQTSIRLENMTEKFINMDGLFNTERHQSESLQTDLKAMEERAINAEAMLEIRMKSEQKSYIDEQEKDYLISDLTFRLQVSENNCEAMNSQKLEMSRALHVIKSDKQYLAQRLEAQRLQFDALQTQHFQIETKLVGCEKLEEKFNEKANKMREKMREAEEQREQSNREQKDLESDLEFAKNKIQLFQKDIIELESKITEMKEKRTQLEDEYIKTKMRLQSFQGAFQAQDESCRSLENQLVESKDTYSKLLLQFRNLTDQSTREVESLQARLLKADKDLQIRDMDWKVEFDAQNILQSTNESLVREMEKQRLEKVELDNALKNEQFTVITLNQRVNQLTVLYDEEKDRKEKILQTMTQLTHENEILVRDNKGLNYVVREENLKRDEKIKTLLSSYTEEIERLKESNAVLKVPTIMYEDLYSRLRQLQEKYQQSQIESQMLLTQIEVSNQSKEKLEIQIKQLEAKIAFGETQVNEADNVIQYLCGQIKRLKREKQNFIMKQHEEFQRQSEYLNQIESLQEELQKEKLKKIQVQTTIHQSSNNTLNNINNNNSNNHLVPPESSLNPQSQQNTNILKPNASNLSQIQESQANARKNSEQYNDKERSSLSLTPENKSISSQSIAPNEKVDQRSSMHSQHHQAPTPLIRAQQVTGKLNELVSSIPSDKNQVKGNESNNQSFDYQKGKTPQPQNYDQQEANQGASKYSSLGGNYQPGNISGGSNNHNNHRRVSSNLSEAPNFEVNPKSNISNRTEEEGNKFNDKASDGRMSTDNDHFQKYGVQLTTQNSQGNNTSYSNNNVPSRSGPRNHNPNQFSRIFQITSQHYNQ